MVREGVANTRQALFRIAIVAAAGVAGLGLLYAASLAVARTWPGGEALRYPWEALRAFFFRGENPYHRLALLYAWAQQDGVAVAPQPYPFPETLALLSPLALLDDFMLARAWALWGGALGLLATLVMAARALRWRPGRGLGAMTVAFVLTGYFSVVALLRADVVVLVAVLLAAALMSVLAGRDDLAGVALAFTLVKPDVVLYPALFLLLWAVSRRRWRLWCGFWGMTFLLLALAFWLQPSWPLEMAFLLVRFGSGPSPRFALAQAVPGVGRQLGWLMTAGVAVAVLAEWVGAWGRSPHQAVWTTTLTVLGALLVGGRISPADQVLLLLPLLLVWVYWSSRWKAYGRPASAAVLLLLWVLPWLAWGGDLFSGSGACLSVGMCFAEPLVVWVLLYTVRWWATRAPVLSPEALLE